MAPGDAPSSRALERCCSAEDKQRGNVPLCRRRACSSLKSWHYPLCGCIFEGTPPGKGQGPQGRFHGMSSVHGGSAVGLMKAMEGLSGTACICVLHEKLLFQTLRSARSLSCAFHDFPHMSDLDEVSLLHFSCNMTFPSALLLPAS